MIASALDILAAVIPAQAGIQLDRTEIAHPALDSRLRGNDTVGAEK